MSTFCQCTKDLQLPKGDRNYKFLHESESYMCTLIVILLRYSVLEKAGEVKVLEDMFNPIPFGVVPGGTTNFKRWISQPA